MVNIDLQSLQEEYDNKEWCNFEALDIQTDSIKINLSIPTDLVWFEGHFPNQPVLPGVVQTHWACELAKYCFKVSHFEKVINLKFTQIVLPEIRLALHLRFNPEKKSVMFTFKNNTETFSSGSLRFK